MHELLGQLVHSNRSIMASNGYVSSDTGIRPVIEPIIENKDFFKGLTVADKVIGKASALLLIYSGCKEVHTLLISKSAIEVLNKNHISFSYEKECDYIINRTKDDMCPMEKTVLNIDDPKEAFEALKNKLKYNG